MAGIGINTAYTAQVYKNLLFDVPNLMGQITVNYDDITQLGNIPTSQQFYKTLVYRQLYDSSNKFTNFQEFQNTNTQGDPTVSTKYSILEQISDIKDDNGPYVFMVKLVNYASVETEGDTEDHSTPGKNVIAFSQGSSPIYNVIKKRGISATVLHSTGCFRASTCVGSLKASSSGQTEFFWDFMRGFTYTYEHYHGIGYCETDAVPEYDYFRTYSYRPSAGTGGWIQYNNPTIEMYVISRNNYSRPGVENDNITTPLEGSSYFNLKYI